MLDINEIIKRQKAYLERINKGEEEITKKEKEDAIYSGDTISGCDLDEYRFQIFKIALEKGYYHPDDICFPYILTQSRNLYIRKYAGESILDGNPSQRKPECLRDELSYMEGDEDAEELSAYWDKCKKEINLEISELKKITFDEKSLLDLLYISDINKLTTISRNKEIEKLITHSEFLIKYPHYGKRIKENFEKGLERSKQTNSALTTLNAVFFKSVPVTHEISETSEIPLSKP